MKAKLCGIAILLVFGVAKAPLEVGMTQSLRERGLQVAPPVLDWQENFGQMAFATLGGLRYLGASIMFLQAYTAWEKLDWGEVDSLMTLTTRLQPTEPSYWDEAAWHMAYNAAGAYLRNKELRFATRHENFRKHVDRGIAILEEGLRYIPDHPLLLRRLAEIYGGSQARRPDPRLAAQYYLASYENGGPEFCERMAAYEMVKLSDRASWEKAYEILKRYYDRGKPFNTMARILLELPELERRLDIPEKDRIRPPQPFVPQIPLKRPPAAPR